VGTMDDHALRALAVLGLEATDPEGRARTHALVERNTERARQMGAWVAALLPDPMVRVSRDDLRAVLDGLGAASETRFPAAAARLREQLDR
jgi:hypothetical protein